MIRLINGSIETEYDDLPDFVCRRLDSEREGRLEAVQETVDTLCEAFGRLLEIKDVTIKEALYIVDGYVPYDIEIETDLKEV